VESQNFSPIISNWAVESAVPAVWQSHLQLKGLVHSHLPGTPCCLVKCYLLSEAEKRQCAQKMSVNSTNNRGFYFTVLLKGIKCLRVVRVFLRVLFQQHLCFGAQKIDLETSWFSELLLTCSSQWKLWFVTNQTIFTQVKKTALAGWH